MKFAKSGAFGAVAVVATLSAGHAVADGHTIMPYGAGYGSGTGYGMPYSGPQMAYPQRPPRPQPPARPQPPERPQMGGPYQYGYPMGRAYMPRGYGMPGRYGMNRGYGMGYGRAAAPAAPPAEPAAPAEATETAAVDISQMRFNAPTVTIKAGGTVTWTNREGVPHTVTATDGSFGSSQLTAGDSFSHTFTEPGTYSYFCQVHPTMRATVVVEG